MCVVCVEISLSIIQMVLQKLQETFHQLDTIYFVVKFWRLIYIFIIIYF